MEIQLDLDRHPEPQNLFLQCGDPEDKSRNGKLLEKVVEENDLIVVNGTNLCKGVITRYRKTVNNTERSVIDFFIVCRRFFMLIIHMEIDENRIFSLTKFSNKIGDKRHKESDHNTLILNIQSNWVTTVNEENKREEIYNYKNKDDFQKFVKETEYNKELVNRFDDTEEELVESSDKWLSIVNTSIKKSFKRICKNKLKQNKELDSLFQRK